MNDPVCEVEFGGEWLVLLPERALFWPRQSLLAVADLHLGKSATFRRAGVPVPTGATRETLNRLDRALGVTGARTLVIVGDFFHSFSGRAAGTLALLADWFARHRALDCVLVTGNHDRHAGAPPREWGVRCVEPAYHKSPFTFVHEKSAAQADAAIAGHIHPVVRLSGPGGARERCPCFHVSASGIVLPAFGTFTGGHSVRPSAGDRLFALGEGTITEVRVASG